MPARFFGLIGAIVLAASTAALPSAAQPRPNVVVILADDLGWADVGFQGSTFYETPHLDRLAGRSVVFTNGYASSPVCSPTRAALLTGRHPARLDVTDWIAGRPNRPDQRLLQVEDLDHLPLEETTLAEIFRDAGYATAHIGKWHLGGDRHAPEAQGFDLNIAGNHRGYPPTYHHPYDRDGYRLAGLDGGRDGEYLTDRLSEEAVRFVADHRDRPFFLHLAHYAVHTPLEAREDLAARYRKKADALGLADSLVWGDESGHRYRRAQNHAVYAAMVESLDESVGRVLEALERNGVADRTIIVFTSDNGGLATSEGWPTTNLPLRAGKGWLYEGGLRVPTLVYRPGAAPRRVEAPVSSIDVFPTLIDLAGLERPGIALDGESIAPLLEGIAAPVRDTLFWHYPHYSNQGGRPGGAIRAGRFKLVEFFEDGRVELYDLQDDPGERHDLARTLPAKAAELREYLARWRAAIGARMPMPNPAYRH